MAEGTVEAAAKALHTICVSRADWLTKVGRADEIEPCVVAAHEGQARLVLAAVTPLIRASVVAECAQAIEAERDRKPKKLWGKFSKAAGGWVDRDMWLSHAAALVRALVSPLEGDKT